MAGSSGYSATEAVLLMTLCEYAYIDERPLPGETVAAQQARMARDINAALAASPYANWQVAWGPGLDGDRGNMMYVAGNHATNQYVVAIRGTDWSFWLDWLEDFAAVLGLVPFPYLPATAGQDIKIAAGTAVGLQALVQMTGATSSAQVSLLTFVRQQAPGAQFFVTGHSLGGCLASAVAPWLAFELGGAGNLAAYTFAAPSAGNSAFADYYNQLFTDTATGASTAYRVYNTLDAVPNGWASLPVIETYYTPFPPCTTDIKTIIEDAANFVGTTYTQPGIAGQGSAVPLPGQVTSRPAAARFDPIGDALFLYEVAQQHASTTYLRLLAAPPVPAAAAKVRGARFRVRPPHPGSVR
jgi:hypothetical protein